MHNTRSSRTSFPFCLSAQDKETEWKWGNRRSFSAQKLFFGRSRIERRIDTAKIMRQQSPSKLSSSYCYCYCNCYCNRDSYMKCNNNNNNILLHLLLLLLFFAVTVLLHLSFHFTICTLYQHGTLCSPLPFPSLLSSSPSPYCSVNACKFPTLCGENAQQLQSSTLSLASLSSRSACKLPERVCLRERRRKGDRGSA